MSLSVKSLTEFVNEPVLHLPMTYLEQLNELLDEFTRGWHTDSNGPREETDEEFHARVAVKGARPTGGPPPSAAARR